MTIDLIRTEFNISVLRRGKRDEFNSGQEFEQFMFGYHSEPNGKETYEDLKSFTPRALRRHLFLEAILWSIDHKKDFHYLDHLAPQCFAPTLFRDIQNYLPFKERDELEMYAVVGTPFDYDYGVDMMFIFKQAVVTIDVTINPQQKSTKERHHFIFSNFHLSQRATTEFAKTVAHALQKRGFHKELSIHTKRLIKDALDKRSAVI